MPPPFFFVYEYHYETTEQGTAYVPNHSNAHKGESKKNSKHL